MFKQMLLAVPWIWKRIPNFAFRKCLITLSLHFVNLRVFTRVYLVDGSMITIRNCNRDNCRRTIGRPELNCRFVRRRRRSHCRFETHSCDVTSVDVNALLPGIWQSLFPWDSSRRCSRKDRSTLMILAMFRSENSGLYVRIILSFFLKDSTL